MGTPWDIGRFPLTLLRKCDYNYFTQHLLFVMLKVSRFNGEAAASLSHESPTFSMKKPVSLRRKIE